MEARHVMSTSVSVTPQLPSTGSESEMLLGVSLRSGDEMTLDQLDAIARKKPITLIVLVGPPDSGKTTLLSSLYEKMRVAGIPKLNFAGSGSLVAFEKRAHLSRVVSQLTAADTERTKFSDEQVFYHIRACPLVPPYTPVDLFLLDVAGEGFKELRTTHSACHRLSSLAMSDFLTVLIDGKRLQLPKTRHAAIEDCVNFLQCAWDSGAVANSCRVQIVVTKADSLPADAEQTLLPTIKTQIRQRLAHRFVDFEFMSVAARPETINTVPSAFGIAELVETWMTGPNQSESEPTQAPSKVNGERESEAYGHRYLG